MAYKHDASPADTVDSEFGETTGHVYDGIQEYDNPTPGWWNWLFVGSVVFSVFYWIYFHSGVPGRSTIEQYNSAVAANMQLRFGELGELTGSRAEMIRFTQDPEWLKVGEIVYATNCVSCHGKDGGGIQGPNLTDEHYKNARQIEDLYQVVAEGANNGAMPSWRNRLHPNEVVLVACYVASLRGTTPANPKAPEGNVIAPWPTVFETPKDEAASPDDTPEASNETQDETQNESPSGDSDDVELPLTDPAFQDDQD